MEITKNIVFKIRKISVSSTNLNRYLKNHYSLIYKKILQCTNFLDIKYGKIKSISIFERLYCIEHNLQDRPLCQTCGKEHVCGFNLQTNEYKKWCSPRCQASDRNCIEKSKETRKIKYGNENYNGIEKSRQTRFQKNDGKWHSLNFDKKCKETNLKIHGNTNWRNTEKAKDTITKKIRENSDFWNNRELKTKETKIKNGHNANWNNREMYHKTCIEKYGVKSYTQSDDWKTKTKLTIKQNKSFYIDRAKKTKQTIDSIENFYKVRDKKTKETNLRKYGKEYFLQTNECRQKRNIAFLKQIYDTLNNSDTDFPAFNIDELSKYKNISSHEFKFQCKKCNSFFHSILIGSYHVKCKKCFPIPKSKQEEEIYDFLKSFYDKEIIHRKHGRKIIYPHELDIFIPALKIGIEYDGLYWHSQSAKIKKPILSNYHIEKTDKCNKKGIQLIHIFENEWKSKKEIVQSRIKNLFGKYENIVFARKCEVREVDSKISREFQERTHIQGSVNAKVNLGLFYKDQLVALMTFGKPRFNKKYEWELLRFCTELGYHIPGGAGKLLKYFERNYNPKSLISYADRRWSQGKLYKALGFQLDHISKPDYWYFKIGIYKLEHRSKYQKHKLKNILDVFDPSISEFENMKNNGYARIFDCGNLVFTKSYLATSSETFAD